MRWQFGRRSNNVEDQRGRSLSGPVVGGGIGTLLVVLVSMFLGIDPGVFLNNEAPTNNPNYPSTTRNTNPQEQELAEFVSVVLADTEDTWSVLFRQMGRTYREPKLVLFSDYTRSACGQAQSSMGPFYCPADEKVYVDLSFYRDLKNKFGAPGDFAQAYVIAHEVGHHVQTQLGISQQVQQLRRRVSEVEANQLSVRLELQADCFAGVWAHHAQRARNILEQGDIEEAINAASSIGDDRLQKRAQGYIVPESFTHGSGKQRVRWFSQGLQYGDINKCDTFSIANP